LKNGYSANEPACTEAKKIEHHLDIATADGAMKTFKFAAYAKAAWAPLRSAARGPPLRIRAILT
jgi:hypothetical protein